MPRSHKILRTDVGHFPITAGERELYQEYSLQVIEIDDASLEALSAHRDTEALCVVSSKISKAMIDHLSHLQVLSRFGSGTDNIDVEAASQRGIPVVNVPDFCLSEVADHTMALLLGAARHIRPLDQATRSGHWRARVTERLQRIGGKQLGLVGLGRIAQEVARRARAFGLKIAAHDPLASSEVFLKEGVSELSFEELLSTSDYVSLHVPLTPATHHMMGAEQFARMKPGAIFINTARGAVVDEAALVSALQSGRLGGAALDVYEGLNMFGPLLNEVDHPLFHLPNVLLTPHAAACSEEAFQELMSSGARNAIDVLQGRRPKSCVNLEVFGRAGEGTAIS